MPYKIERNKYGLVKRFSGLVTFEDVLQSEQQVTADENYTTLRYVISDYIGSDYRGITEQQRIDINALRIGGHHSNPRIKYAFVIENPMVRAQIKDAVAGDLMLHQAQIFDTFEQAVQWVEL